MRSYCSSTTVDSHVKRLDNSHSVLWAFVTATVRLAFGEPIMNSPGGISTSFMPIEFVNSTGTLLPSFSVLLGLRGVERRDGGAGSGPERHRCLSQPVARSRLFLGSRLLLGLGPGVGSSATTMPRPPASTNTTHRMRVFSRRCPPASSGTGIGTEGAFYHCRWRTRREPMWHDSSRARPQECFATTLRARLAGTQLSGRSYLGRFGLRTVERHCQSLTTPVHIRSTPSSLQHATGRGSAHGPTGFRSRFPCWTGLARLTELRPFGSLHTRRRPTADIRRDTPTDILENLDPKTRLAALGSAPTAAPEGILSSLRLIFTIPVIAPLNQEQEQTVCLPAAPAPKGTEVFA